MRAAQRGVLVPRLGERYPDVVVGFSTLDLGSVHLRPDHERQGQEARHRLASALGVPHAFVTAMGAVHGAEVARVDRPAAWVDDVDGLVTNVRDVGLLATFGDCYPIVVFDPVHSAVGLAHAGWRGTAAGVAATLVAAMQREYRSQPGDLEVVIGPGICGNCYDVGEDVAERFPESAVKPAAQPGQFLLDVGEANRLALAGAGVDPAKIERTGVCTKETLMLPSHRRDHDGRRFAALVALR